MPDFRQVRDDRIKDIADHLEKSGGMDRSKAVEIAEKRMERAMPRVVRECEDAGKSKITEIRSK